MTQRERILSMLVGGMLVLVVVWWGFGKYRAALDSRHKQITSLQQKQIGLREQVMQGHIADRQMGEYLVRSLPSNTEEARTVYQHWLLSMVRENNLSGAKVDPSNPIPVRDLYNRFGFRVTGQTDKPSLIRLLHAFYAKDYLHRISSLTVRQKGGPETLQIEMSVDVVGLMAAPEDAEPPGSTSWRVDPDVMAYLNPIMNRNYFRPPNGAPRFDGRSRVEAFVGRDSAIQLAFKDPEGNRIRYEFAESPPDFVRLDERTGILRVNSDEKQEVSLRVRATDSGYPNRSIEQELQLAIVDPPKPPPPPAPKLKFDDATQTVLTGLVQGSDDWTAWMHVRTRNKTVKLKVGDAFEIGSLKGQVFEVSPKFVVLEIDGRRFTLKQGGNLKEAADRATID